MASGESIRMADMKRKTAVGLSRPPFAESGAHLFAWHGTGQSLLDAELKAIGEARSSIEMEMFIFRDSPIGERFRDALIAAAQRQVRVRLLVDAFGSFSLKRDYFAGLVAAGGAMRWFNELRLSSASFRDHRKVLVVDGAAAFVGGCNIATEYYGDSMTAWRDGGASVRGLVAAVLVEEFERQWERATAFQWPFPLGGYRQPIPADTRGEIEVLYSKPGLGRNPFREALREDLAQASDVAITCAYFLPSPRLRRHLARAVARGARVRVLAAGKSDVPLMQLATRSLYRRLLNRGIKIWEYQPQVLHAKVIVVDDIVYVGSSNLDPRSLRINFEIMLRIRDVAMAETARRQFEEDLAQRSLPITAVLLRRNRSWWQRLKQRAAYWFFARLDPELAALRLQSWRRGKDRVVRRFQGASTPLEAERRS